MSSSPLDPGRRNVVLASGAAMALGLAGGAAAAIDSTPKERRMSTLVIRNARITTLDPQQPHAQALAVQNGRIAAVGSDEQIMREWGNEATILDAQGRRIVPGLNDSHTHLIRGGLNYNLELRWDGLRSLARSCATRWATRPACCWPSPTRSSCTRRWPRAHACRSSTRPIPPATSCAS